MRKTATANSKNITDKKLAELKENANGILADARRNMLNDLPFVGSVAMSLDLIPVRDKNLATAATDGKRVFFDIAFLSTLRPEEIKFVIAHETYHCVMMHFMRQAGRNNTQWNYATDIEVNNLLIADGLSMVAGGLCSKKFGFDVGLSAEDYYELLNKQQPNNSQNTPNKNNNGSNGSKSGDSQGESDNQESDQSGNANGEMDGQFDTHIYQDSDMTANGNSDDIADKYGKVGSDPDFQPKVEENTVEKVRQIVLSAAQQVERSRGTLPAHIQGIVQNILKPQMPWKELLSQWVTKTVSDKTTWSRPNRRFVSSGIYLPSQSGEKIKIGVIMDTSGSCTNDGPKFLAEVNDIVKSFEYEMTFIQCDAQVQKVDTYSEENPLDLENTAFEISGFGGTYLTPAFNHIKDNDIDVDCIVCFTDAEIESIPEDFSETPILWVIVGGSKAENIKCGEKIWFKD